ncbi:MAG: YmfQ family protein [Ramlibacter sp.]
MSVQTIRDALLASLPPVSYDPSAPQVLRESLAPATVLAGAEQLIADIWREQDPHFADVTLADWERVLGLPDCCTTTAQTVEERVAAVVEKWLMRGRLDRAYYVAMMARRGVAITIDELGNHKWRVNAPMFNYKEFLAGAAVAGDPLRDWGLEPMECRITRLKPAHTLAVFGYAVTPGAENNLDFTANQCSPLITSTGGLKRTYVDRDGVRRASVSAARLDFDPKGRTNHVRNSGMRGAVAGTPGTTPDNWLVTTGGGVTRQVLGTGVVRVGNTDVPYIDVRFSAAAAVNSFVVFETFGQIAAAQGQTWTGSAYLQMLAGSTANLYFDVDVVALSAAAAIVGENFVAFVPTATLTRRASTSTLASALTAFLQHSIRIVASGAYDITLRIGLPQLERSAAATPGIVTFNGAATVFDCRGLLNELDTANQVRNNKMGGVVPGSSGTMPTYWATTPSTGTFTRTVIGTGVEDGIPYVEVRLQFTGASANAAAFAFESSTQIAALVGEKWHTSVYCRIVAGSLTNLDAIVYINELNVAGAFITNGTSSLLSMTTAPLREQRFSLSRTVVDGLTRYVLPGVYFYNAAGAADITIRIGYPQAEKRDFSTFPVPTDVALETGTAATHLIGGASFSSYYNPLASTFVIDFVPFALVGNEVFWGVGQAGVFNNSAYLVYSGGQLALIVYSGGVNTAALLLGALVPGNRYKVAISMRPGEIAARVNGGAEQLSAGAMPLVVNNESLLCTPWNGGSSYPAAWLRQRQYFPRARRAELASLSTL